ncbi:MAG TPA: transcriptional repressor [Nitrospirae bacterium]|nr:transcriptional regulator PerR [bacterium BMS3Abin06]HDH13084.1 transcriptional repressor [Nitrospirota bacterium]HDZ02896.1 transcriptional repressor [Nitrospirota bacterium]
MGKFINKGLKLTPQRAAIFEYLDGNKSHPSAEEIFIEIKKRYPMISFATVYKTLEALKSRGDLLELSLDPERRRYDPDTSPHHHLVCIKCKKIVDIHKDFSLEIPEEAKVSFDIIGNHIEFYGICPDCRKKGGAENGSL